MLTCGYNDRLLSTMYTGCLLTPRSGILVLTRLPIRVITEPLLWLLLCSQSQLTQLTGGYACIPMLAAVLLQIPTKTEETVALPCVSSG